MNTHTRVRGRVIVRSLLVAWLAASGVGLAVAAAPASGTPSGTTASPGSASQPAQLSVHARTHHILSGGREVVTGSVSTGQAGRTVVARVNRGRGWKSVAHARTRGGGRFSLSWRQRGVGHYAVRIALAATSTKRDVGGGLTVYRRSQASWYGPGFYGHRTACGGTLSPHTLGVANKTLPCGTRVMLKYGNRRVTVPVIDRGPYVAGREYDLTSATKNRLHFGSTGTLWSAPKTR